MFSVVASYQNMSQDLSIHPDANRICIINYESIVGAMCKAIWKYGMWHLKIGHVVKSIRD